MKRVGFIKNINGKLRGYYQGGQGQLRSIQSVMHIGGKEMVIVGAGNVAISLLSELSKLDKLPKSVIVLNRTVEKLEKLSKYKFVKLIGSIDQIKKVSGDILVNATDIGVRASDALYTQEIIARFGAVFDVTFEKEDTNFIQLARKMGKKCATGWDMFTYQGQVVLETILDIKIKPEILKKHVVAGLSQVVK